MSLGSSTALDRGEITAQVVAARPDPNLNGTLITGPDAVTAAGDYLNHCLVTPGDSSRRLTAPLRDLVRRPPASPRRLPVVPQVTPRLRPATRPSTIYWT
jgi:hypothetical protein